MIFSAENIRLTGRWHTAKDGSVVTTACGSAAEFAFCGKSAVIHFNIDYMKHPYPHIWLCVDGGAYTECVIDRFLRVEANTDGEHMVKIVLKSCVEMQHRWFAPLEAKLHIQGVEAESVPPLPCDERPVIEFVGDSITEGILVDEKQRKIEATDFLNDQDNRVYQDDVRGAYAYRTAELLNCRAAIFAYGGVGITKGGSGGVPKAAAIYNYCFDGAECIGYTPDTVVVNYGANDWSQPSEKYLAGYEELLCVIRAKHRDAKIVILNAFSGVFAEKLSLFAGEFN